MRRAVPPLAMLALALAWGLAPAALAKPRPRPAEPSILEPAEPAHAAPAPARPKPPQPRDLAQASEAQVRARLGAPDVSHDEGTGGLWTYRFHGCALMVFFKAGDGQPLRVSGLSAGPRRRGQASPTVEACLAQAVEPRNDPSQADDPIQAILDAPSPQS